MELEELLQHIDIGEDQETEFKSADGGLPNEIWATVSAFANTDGGYIILGVSENKSGLIISGVNKPNILLKNFWNNHNNPQKLSAPVCSNSNVQVLEVETQNLVVITVPRATRTQRPVYINNNPMTGTFKRNFEGDYRCTQEEVRQMLRDAANQPQDIQILEGFTLNDLDPETLKTFRQRFNSREPDHPWLGLDDKNLLIQLGGWKYNRMTGQEGLTVAGLLMFGRERNILDAFPHYQLDYQERLSKNPETRWTYRLTLDGKWEANLFNFYYRVYGRLVDDINVPFQLDSDAVRKGETHVHEALREALVNSLIHADHLSTRPTIITKFKNSFLFLNPGRLRISLQQLYDGGISDPRNPSLQKMFQMLGLSEKAGSGFGKIIRAWKEQQWFIPLVSEKLDLEMTSVALPMTSLIPENVEKELKEIVGDNYSELTELDRIILVLAHQFGEICNSDIQVFCREHPRDIGECLKRLVNKGWLERSGHRRGTHYTLINKEQSLVPSSEHYEQSPEHYEQSSEHYEQSSEHYEQSSEHYEQSSEHYEQSPEHYEESSEHYKRLQAIATPVRQTGRTSKELVEQVILELCSEHYLQLRTLAQLLGREPDSIRNHYINPMIERGLLETRYPGQPSHPQQAYKTTFQQDGEVSEAKEIDGSIN